MLYKRLGLVDKSGRYLTIFHVGFFARSISYCVSPLFSNGPGYTGVINGWNGTSGAYVTGDKMIPINPCVPPPSVLGIDTAFALSSKNN